MLTVDTEEQHRYHKIRVGIVIADSRLMPSILASQIFSGLKGINSEGTFDLSNSAFVGAQLIIEIPKNKGGFTMSL